MLPPGTRFTLLVIAAILVLPLAGCGEEGADPGDTVREVFAAYNARDFGKVYDLSSAELQQQAGTRDEAVALMEASWPQGTEVVDLDITEETVSGGEATVKWSGTIRTPGIPDEPGSATVRLVKESGDWRLAGDDAAPAG